ncbi:NAD-dependent epimerase/dehydratase family protein [Candidatus Heimdallarchaeota archaeon]|jgi:nucleoside-diphosphate-sugar epimerase|nr:MAG: NAD-dependent epimerase/dehydratase family protein [Candidatus Heimdallarchaeota archaeon]
MTILITGGAGFIGHNLAIRLCEAEQKVLVVDLVIDDISNKKEEITYLKGDISDFNFLEKLFKEYSFKTIFHLAAILPPKTEEDPFRAFKVNCEGTLNILELAVKYDIETIIYPSSATVFGPDRKPPFTEEDLLNPWTVYSSFKVCSEIFGALYSRKYDLNFRAVRLPVVIGPGRDRLLGMTNYPVEMVEKAIKGQPYVAQVEPDTKVPIIYIDDAVQVLVNLWRSEQVQFEIYNIDGIWATAKEIAEGIKKVIPSAEISFKPVEDEHMHKVLTGLKEKKKESMFSYRGHRLLDEILQEYINRYPSEGND